jgi:Asp-tRNA(Asn)/Glu-tRNA(Gln) amidotransferase A subunit family amidase
VGKLYVALNIYFRSSLSVLTGPVDNPEIQHGTPVGIQIVGRRFQEEKLIKIAELFENALRDPE